MVELMSAMHKPVNNPDQFILNLPAEMRDLLTGTGGKGFNIRSVAVVGSSSKPEKSPRVTITFFTQNSGLQEHPKPMFPSLSMSAEDALYLAGELKTSAEAAKS